MEKKTCEMCWNHYDWTWLDPIDYNALPSFAFDETGLVCDPKNVWDDANNFEKVQTNKNHMGTDYGKNQENSYKKLLSVNANSITV